LTEVGGKRAWAERERVGRIRGGWRVTAGWGPDHVGQGRVVDDPLGRPLHGRLLLARVLVKAVQLLLLMVERTGGRCGWW